MKYTDLEVFMGVVEAGSFSKAAERLGYTPAGVSYIISEIEKELEMPLFRRSHNGVRLNAHGMDILPELKMIFQANKNLDDKVRSRKEGKTVNFHIGVLDTVAAEWMPDAMIEFSGLYPNTKTDIMTGNPYELNDWMESGLIHLMITEDTWIDSSIAMIPIYKDPFYMVFPKNSDVPKEAGLELMQGWDVVTPFYGGDRTAEILLRRMGIDFNPTYDRVNNIALVKMVALGKGASVLPGLHLREARLWAMEERCKPKVVRIVPDIGRQLVVGIRNDSRNNELLNKFIECVRHSAYRNSDWEEMKK